MSKYQPISKLIKVIDSCNTFNQLHHAEKYMYLWFDRFKVDDELRSIIWDYSTMKHYNLCDQKLRGN